MGAWERGEKREKAVPGVAAGSFAAPSPGKSPSCHYAPLSPSLCPPKSPSPKTQTHTPLSFPLLAFVRFFPYCLSVCLLGFKIFCFAGLLSRCDLSVFCWFVLCVIPTYWWCFMAPLKQFNESDLSRADKQAVNLWKTMWMAKWSWEHSKVDYRSKINKK